MAKRKQIEKPFSNGTMSNAAFFGMIRSSLRQKSRWWKPISQCKQAAKRSYKGPNKRQKFEYQCNECKEWFSDKQTNVDHIVPAGSLNSFEDLPNFVKRLFCDSTHLQVLCSTCHNKKTKEEKTSRNEEKSSVSTNSSTSISKKPKRKR